MSAAEDQLRDIGKAPNRFAAPPAAGAGAKKRRPGRPRKNKEKLNDPPPPPPVVEEPDDFEIGEDPDDAPPPRTPPDSPPPLSQKQQQRKKPDDGAGTLSKRLEACSIIEQLKKRLNAVGSGMQPDAAEHSLKQLEAEIELLNNQINAARGDNSIKTLAITVIAPSISALVHEVMRRIDAEKTIDLTGYDREVAENWDVLFADAAAQISINNPSWFASSPWAVMAEGALLCGVSANMKNAVKQQANAKRANMEE
jgi:hypothetical protein